MTSKAYIVANEQQEREVLEKLEQEGLTWISGIEATEWEPQFIPQYPYTLINGGEISWKFLSQLEDEEIAFDGRKEEKMSDKLNRTLVIFTNNGQSFMFKHVTDFKYTTTGFEFSYAGEMTGVERHAVFNNTSIAGYALSD